MSRVMPGDKYDDFYDCPKWDGIEMKRWLPPPEKLKTHHQTRCEECGFFHVWVLKMEGDS